MTSVDGSSMTQSALLFARTISISAATGVKIMDNTGTEGTMGTDPDTDCGCLPEPPSFNLPPPPIPPAIGGMDWINGLGSDGGLEWCEREIEGWTTRPGMVEDDNDEIYSTPTGTPPIFHLFHQPLTGIVIIAAASSIILLSICLLALYCRRKSHGPFCSPCDLHSTKEGTSSIYEHQNGYPHVANGKVQQHQRKAKLVTIVDGASPATTASMLAPASSTYHGHYCPYDSDGEISQAENEHLFRNRMDPRSAVPTHWSYSAMRPEKKNGKKLSGNEAPNGLVESCSMGRTKYGAIPTSPVSYQNITQHRPLPVMLVRTDNGKIISTTSQMDQSSLLYDSHNPIYEEISLHENSSDQYAPTQPIGVVSYMDSGADSADSDHNLDGKERLAVGNSPCCSSGPSDCEECSHEKNDCPFSPKSRKRNQFHHFPSTSSMTPSPIRNKLQSNKVNRSTQSGESYLCCECSGRESGYGTQSRCQSTTPNRIKNRSNKTRFGITVENGSPGFYTIGRVEHSPGQKNNRGKIGSPKSMEKKVKLELLQATNHDEMQKSAFV